MNSLDSTDNEMVNAHKQDRAELSLKGHEFVHLDNKKSPPSTNWANHRTIRGDCQAHNNSENKIYNFL